jgi:hypothetical protein
MLGISELAVVSTIFADDFVRRTADAIRPRTHESKILELGQRALVRNIGASTKRRGRRRQIRQRVFRKRNFPVVEIRILWGPFLMDGREHLINKISHMDIPRHKSYSILQKSTEYSTYEDLYPANSSNSIFTSPLESIVKILALGTLTLRYERASVIRFPNPA